jgi:hypothetical protein
MYIRKENPKLKRDKYLIKKENGKVIWAFAWKKVEDILNTYHKLTKPEKRKFLGKKPKINTQKHPYIEVLEQK